MTFGSKVKCRSGDLSKARIRMSRLAARVTETRRDRSGFDRFAEFRLASSGEVPEPLKGEQMKDQRASQGIDVLTHTPEELLTHDHNAMRGHPVGVVEMDEYSVQRIVVRCRRFERDASTSWAPPW